MAEGPGLPRRLAVGLTAELLTGRLITGKARRETEWSGQPRIAVAPASTPGSRVPRMCFL